MTKIKIGKVDEYDYHAIAEKGASKMQQLIPVLQQAVSSVDTSVLQDILTGKGKTRKELEQSIQEEIKRVTIPAMKQRLQSELTTVLNNFDKAVQELIKEAQTITFIPVENYVIENSRIAVIDYNELINEACTVYITDQEDVETYNLAKEVTEKLNELNKRVAPLHFHAVTGMLGHGIIDFSIENQYSVNPHRIASFQKIRESEKRQNQILEKLKR